MNSKLKMQLATVIVALAMVSPRQANSQQAQVQSAAILYDDFSEKWLDPAKWKPINPNCWGNVLECVREIRDGRLRLAVRNFGDTNSDSGIQYDESEVYFADPNPIKSITADIRTQFAGIGCLTNNTDATHTQVQIGGRFFNTGSGNPNDDISVWLIIWIDTFDPTTMHISVYWGYPWPLPATDVPFASYPVGTELTSTLIWDKANHRFIGKTKVEDEEGQGAQVEIPYYLPDTAPPANPEKRILASQHTLNCTSAKTNGQVEARVGNVIISR
jgi:hypothetical protein